MTTTTYGIETRKKGGFHAYFIGLEIKRVLTNVSTLVFCCAMPIVFYLLFGFLYGGYPAGLGNSNAETLAMMGIYGAAMTAATPAYSLPRERIAGWSRQLRLTPLRPVMYVLGKIIAALVAAAASLLVLYIVGLIVGQAHMPVRLWFATFGVAWLGAIGFSAMGLFIGLVMDKGEPSAVIVPVMLVCSFLSGVFMIPLQGKVWEVIRDIVPMGGLSHWSSSLFGPSVGTTDVWTWVNLIGWTVVFFIAAMWAFSRDTKRM